MYKGMLQDRLIKINW